MAIAQKCLAKHNVFHYTPSNQNENMLCKSHKAQGPPLWWPISNLELNKYVITKSDAAWFKEELPVPTLV
jgi:hypothetical protein